MTVERFDIDRTTIDDPEQTRDIEDIRHLWTAISGEPSRLSTEDARGFMTGMEYWVVRDKRTRKIMGAASLWLMDGALGKLDSIAVREDRRHHGHGTDLTKAALAFAFGEGECDTIIVNALPASQKMLRNLGFEAETVHETGAATMFLDKEDFNGL